MAYGARLESVLGASPHGFESHILRAVLTNSFTNETVKNPLRNQRVLSFLVLFQIPKMGVLEASEVLQSITKHAIPADVTKPNCPNCHE